MRILRRLMIPLITAVVIATFVLLRPPAAIAPPKRVLPPAAPRREEERILRVARAEAIKHDRRATDADYEIRRSADHWVVHVDFYSQGAKPGERYIADDDWAIITISGAGRVTHYEIW